MRDATTLLISSFLLNHYFNPRVPCGTRQFVPPPPIDGAQFQSTRPMRDATIILRYYHASSIFQSTRPMRDATQVEDSDEVVLKDFNPRVPCGTRRFGEHMDRCGAHFTPRVPCGTRLCRMLYIPSPIENFNPRVPCGTRPAGSCSCMQ